MICTKRRSCIVPLRALNPEKPHEGHRKGGRAQEGGKQALEIVSDLINKKQMWTPHAADSPVPGI